VRTIWALLLNVISNVIPGVIALLVTDAGLARADNDFTVRCKFPFSESGQTPCVAEAQICMSGFHDSGASFVCDQTHLYVACEQLDVYDGPFAVVYSASPLTVGVTEIAAFDGQMERPTVMFDRNLFSGPYFTSAMLKLSNHDGMLGTCEIPVL
jgi:hypothetical protein